jgi:eukaryotic-like serine/threonine-protein kinase
MAHRTTLCLALIVTAAVVAAETARPPASPAGEWRHFRGTPSLTGASESTPPATLRVLWTYDAGETIESSPAIADGVVYVGSGDGVLLALDFDTGELRWRYETGDLIGESSPAVGADTVYIGDLAGVLHAVNRRDGTRRWTFTTGSEIKSSPVVVDDVVLVGSYDANLYAVDAATGAERWTLETDSQVHATPAVHDGLAFIAGCDNILRAVRVSDGREMYQIDTGAYIAASPVIHGDRAYVGTFNDEVLGFDLARREQIWRYAPPDRRFPFYSSAALDPGTGRVIVGGRDRHVHALDAATGEAVWTFATRARVDSSPVVAGGRIYIGSNDHRFYVLDVETGRKVWEFDTGAAITASPAVAGGRVVVGATDGQLYVFG